MGTRRYAIIGTGAVGGYYGGLLCRAGFDVHFLLRSDLDHVRSHGLRVDSKHGDFHISNVNAYNDAGDLPPCAVLLVCLKTIHNGQLAEFLRPPALTDSTVIVLMQNGIGYERDAAKIAPDNPVLGGLCFLCCNKVGPGHVNHLDYGAVSLGEHRDGFIAAGVTDAVNRVAEDFAAAQIETTIQEDLTDARWRKLLWNVPYNGLSVVHGVTTDALMEDSARRADVEALMVEVQAGAASMNRRIPDDFVRNMLQYTAKMTPYKTSMMLDFEAGRPLELDAIYARPLALARERGAQLPCMQALYDQLRRLDQRNRARS